LPITYSPDRQEVRVLKARITKPDGSVVDSYGDQDRNINEPWTGMYYDAHARVLSFPSLEPGDVLEVQWRVEDTAVDNLLSDYWGDVDPLQSIYPKKNYVYVVDMPKTRPLYWNSASLPKWVKAESTAEGERVVHRFHAENVAKIIPEPQMPGWAEVASPLHLSTYKSWEDVGRYWWGLVRDQLTPNDELRKTVEQVLKGVDRKDETKVVAAIYGFVVTNTRYVALEFGIHGFKPYRVDRVLARRFGDCKDKASLIVAMLKVAGVDARLVLLRMRNLGTLNAEPASLAAFNHAIAYVPSLHLYLDGTAEFYGSHEMPGADRVANVLIIEPDGKSQFLTTAEAAPEDNVSASTMEVLLKTDGSASARGNLVTRGLSAPDIRRDYQTAATRQSVFEQKWAQSFPGLTASEVTLSDPKLLEQPATLGFAMAMPRFAEASSNTLKFYPFGGSRAFTQVLAPLTERTWDAVFPGVWVDRQTWTYTVPAGWAMAEAPPEAVETSAFGSLRIRVKKLDGGKVLVEGEMVMAKARISAAEYPAFRGWLLRVDQAYSKKLVVQRAGERASR
jgi:transglutaminase-like putative cysteine protease